MSNEILVPIPDLTYELETRDAMLAHATSFVVDSVEAASEAGRRIVECARSRKAVEQVLAPVKSKLKAMRDAFIERETEVLAPFDAARKLYEDGRLSFQRAERARLDELARIERAKADEEAAARRAKAEAAQLERAIQAEQAGDKALADRILEAPTTDYRPAPVREYKHAVPQVKGLAEVTTYDVEVVDARALVAYAAEHEPDLVSPDLVRLRARARAHKEALAIPGVRVVVKTSTRASAPASRTGW